MKDIHVKTSIGDVFYKEVEYTVSQLGILSIFEIKVEDIESTDGNIIYDYESEGGVLAVFNSGCWNYINVEKVY